VQVRALAVKLHLVFVTALVVAIAGVQRLVHVADEVDDKLQGLGALRVGLVPVAQDGHVFLQTTDDTAAIRAVARRHVMAFVIADIDVVERPGGLAQCLLARHVAQMVRPARDVGKGIGTVHPQQARHLGLRRRIELSPGQVRHDPVADVAPGLDGAGEGGNGQGEQDGDAAALQNGFHGTVNVSGRWNAQVCHSRAETRMTRRGGAASRAPGPSATMDV